jgi:hypothetical protein
MPRVIAAAAAALMAKRVVPDEPAIIVTHHATSAVVEASRGRAGLFGRARSGASVRCLWGSRPHPLPVDCPGDRGLRCPVSEPSWL